MHALDIITNLGPLTGTVVVVVLFLRFGTNHAKSERCHREKLAEECHAVQRESIEMTSRTEKTLENVNRTLIRLNGDHR